MFDLYRQIPRRPELPEGEWMMEWKPISETPEAPGNYVVFSPDAPINKPSFGVDYYRGHGTIGWFLKKKPTDLWLSEPLPELPKRYR